MDEPASFGADDAGGVGLVDDHARAGLDERLERRDVAVHGEDGVGDDHVRALRDLPVRIDERLRAREPAAVDDRRVIERIGRDDAVGRERRDHARVGQEPAAEQDARLGPLELGEPLLELLRGCPCARSPAASRRRRHPTAPRFAPPRRARADRPRARGSRSSTGAAPRARRASPSGPARSRSCAARAAAPGRSGAADASRLVAGREDLDGELAAAVRAPARRVERTQAALVLAARATASRSRRSTAPARVVRPR